MKLNIDLIRDDGGTQPRASINLEAVTEYAEAMRVGAVFPPVVVFYDGSEYWLADGFHRLDATIRAGLAEIEAEVKQGTQRDAILYSCGANASHGMRRTNEDKRRAVMRMLEDAEWSTWSNYVIAEKCAVSEITVRRHRDEILTTTMSQLEPSERTYITKHGTITTMNVSNIGSRPESPAMNITQFQSITETTTGGGYAVEQKSTVTTNHFLRGKMYATIEEYFMTLDDATVLRERDALVAWLTA